MTNNYSDIAVRFTEDEIIISQKDGLFGPLTYPRYAGREPMPVLYTTEQANFKVHLSTYSYFYAVSDSKGKLCTRRINDFQEAVQEAERLAVEEQAAPVKYTKSKNQLLRDVCQGLVEAKLFDGYQLRKDKDDQYWPLVKRSGVGSIDICRNGKCCAIFYFHDFSANLIGYTDDRLDIYAPGYRLFTEEETQVWQEWEAKRDLKGEWLDSMTDSSEQFFRKKDFFESRGYGYLLGQRFKGVVCSQKIRGQKMLSYHIRRTGTAA